MTTMTRDQVEASMLDFGGDEKAWLERRYDSIGGSELFPLVYPRDEDGTVDEAGYVSEWSIWQRKRSRSEAELDSSNEDKEWLQYGNDTEPGIVKFAARKIERHDSSLVVVPYRHAIFPDQTGAPMHFSADALVYRKPTWELVMGFDAKRVSVFQPLHAKPEDQWGDEGTSTMPRRCRLQGIAGCTLFDVGEWIFGADRGTVPEMFPLRPAAEDGQGLRELVTDWWQRHMIDGVEPDIDGTAATTEVLKALYSSESALMIGATDEDLEVLYELLEARVRHKTAEQAKAALENRLKDTIGKAGARGIKGVATWGWCKGRKSVDVTSLLNDIVGTFADGWVVPRMIAEGLSETDARGRAFAETRDLVQTALHNHTSRGNDYRRLSLSKKK